MKSFITFMLAGLSLGPAYGMVTDQVFRQIEVTTTQRQSAPTVSVDALTENLMGSQVAKRDCNYEGLAECKKKCAEDHEDNSDYLLCIDQCLGMYDCR